MDVSVSNLYGVSGSRVSVDVEAIMKFLDPCRLQAATGDA